MGKTYTFKTHIFQEGNNTAVEVDPIVIDLFGVGKRIPVVVTINGKSYRSTTAYYSGQLLIPLSAENRTLTGVKGGEQVTVKLEHDDKPRTVEIPKSLKSALTQAKLIEKFELLSYTKRKEFVRQVMDAKTEETKLRRIGKIIDQIS